MELFYLLCSILSSTLTSILHSIPLFLRSLKPPSNPHVLALYEGEVRHVRTRPVHHAFRYPVRYALVDLDLFAAADPKPVTLSQHLSADEARRITGADGPVFLLTVPMSVGYEQNPLSVYYCFDRGQTSDIQAEVEQGSCHLRKCIAEVTNTPWGERVTFIFNPGSDLVAKPLHVSPFMDMMGNWSMRADNPGEKLFIAISVHHPTLGNYFTATLNAKRLPPLSWTRPDLFFWLMPQKVAVWIYCQAFKLWWKNVSFVQHPRYSMPSYRDDALVRDRELCCPRGSEPSINAKEWRQCTWTDAQWPWA